jgi:hypothetical protein
MALERHFELHHDLYTLHQEGIGTFDQRLDRLVDQRLRLHAVSTAVLRAATARSSDRPSVATALGRRRVQLRRQVDKQFAPELAGLDETSAGTAAAVLDVLFAMESIETLRLGRRQSAERTATILRNATIALLRPAKRSR